MCIRDRHSRAGQAYGDIYPNFAHLDLPDVVKVDEVDFTHVDVAFACLPHGASQETIASIIDKVETVVDLSADFRLKSPELYAQTYGRQHGFHDLLGTAVYGLTEYARKDLKGAKLIACPGCYPTSALLALLPAIDADMIEHLVYFWRMSMYRDTVSMRAITDLAIMERSKGFTTRTRHARLSIYDDIRDINHISINGWQKRQKRARWITPRTSNQLRAFQIFARIFRQAINCRA